MRIKVEISICGDYEDRLSSDGISFPVDGGLDDDDRQALHAWTAGVFDKMLDEADKLGRKRRESGDAD